MIEKKQLSKKQLLVIEDLFKGELDEQGVLDRHKVSRNIYDKWLADEHFLECFEQRIDGLHHQSELLIARYGCLAAAKLVQLTESENQETARKACLDIITLAKKTTKLRQSSGHHPESDATGNELSDETSSTILAVLAKEKEAKQV